MWLREGTIYVDREGRKRGPLKTRPSKVLPFFVSEGTKTLSWAPSGTFFADGREDGNDLVAEWLEPAKNVPIDLVPLDHYRRGVAKLFDQGRLY